MAESQWPQHHIAHKTRGTCTPCIEITSPMPVPCQRGPNSLGERPCALEVVHQVVIGGGSSMLHQTVRRNQAQKVVQRDTVTHDAGAAPANLLLQGMKAARKSAPAQ